LPEECKKHLGTSNLNKSNSASGGLAALKTSDIQFLHNPFLRILLIISFFVLAAAFLPVVGFAFIVFIPLLTFFYGAAAGKTKTAIAFFVPVLLIFLISYLLQLNIPYLVILIMGVAGLTIAAVAPKYNSIEKTVVYPSLIVVAALCFYFIYSGFVFSANPWHLLKEYVAQTIEQNINLYDQLPFDKEEINIIRDNKTTLVNFFTGIFPSIALVGSAMIVWINVLLGRNLLRSAKIYLVGLEKLAQWKAPDFLIWIFIIAGGMLLLSDSTIRLICINILIIVFFIYMLQGFAIISFLFQNKNVPVFLRYLFYFLIAAQQFIMILIAAVGLFDIWVDFRRFFQKKQTSA